MQKAGHYNKNRFISMTWHRTQMYQHFKSNYAKVAYVFTETESFNTYLHNQFCKRKPSFMRTYLNPCLVTAWDLHLRCFPLESVFFFKEESKTQNRPPRCALLHHTDYIHHVCIAPTLFDFWIFLSRLGRLLSRLWTCLDVPAVSHRSQNKVRKPWGSTQI